MPLKYDFFTFDEYSRQIVGAYRWLAKTSDFSGLAEHLTDMYPIASVAFFSLRNYMSNEIMIMFPARISAETVADLLAAAQVLFDVPHYEIVELTFGRGRIIYSQDSATYSDFW